MQQWYPQLFVMLSSALESIAPDWIQHSDVKDKVLNKENRDRGTQALAPFEKHCMELNMRASAVTVRKLLLLLTQDDATLKKQATLFEELKGRLIDEMHCEFFFYLSPSEAARYERWIEGWEEIADRFPETLRDIEEMNKCFALSRYTAAMFHALHVAEWGAIELGNFIGASDPKKGWGATERQLRELVKAGHASIPTALKGKFEFLEQMNREIDSMVLAWRHKVEHAANHLAIVPNTEFTPDIAEHIIGAVRIYMQRIVEGIPA